jgi:hypothetical protein
MSVTKFLHNGIKPKVLPLASEREMLKGMSRMVTQEPPVTPKSFDVIRSRTVSGNAPPSTLRKSCHLEDWLRYPTWSNSYRYEALRFILHRR